MDAKLSLPRQTLEDLVIAQARTLFTVDQSAEDQPNMKEVEDLAKNLLDSQLAQWKSEQYIVEDKGQINTELNYGAGVLTINKKKWRCPGRKSTWSRRTTRLSPPRRRRNNDALAM